MVLTSKDNENDDDEDEMDSGERGLDHALYDFPDMEARPAKSYHLVNKRRNHTITCVIVVILLSISMIFLGIVKGIQKSNNNNNASNANKEEDGTSTISLSSYNGIPPPIASGDLPNVCDITALEDVTVTGDSTIKDACMKECKLGLCCITGELNKLNDAIKEAGHEQSEDIKALLNDNDGYKVDVDDCYDEYEIKCSKYEPCLNLLDAATMHGQGEDNEEIKDLETYEEIQIPLADDNLEFICAQKDLDECEALCDAGECCRSLSDAPCNDVFPTECLGYIPCDVLDDKEQQDNEKAFVKGLCTFEYVSTREGKIQCEAACKAAICCFDTDIDCSVEMEELCDDYKPCSILDIVAQAEYHHITDSDDKINNNKNELDLKSSISNACTTDSILVPEGKDLCANLCTPAQCCFNNNDECETDKSTFCTPYTNCDILYNIENQEEKELTIKQQVDKTCHASTSFKEKDECKLICQDHICCVDPNEQFGCFTDDDEEYCKNHLSCSNLFTTAISSATNNNKNDHEYYYFDDDDDDNGEDINDKTETTKINNDASSDVAPEDNNMDYYDDFQVEEGQQAEEEEEYVPDRYKENGYDDKNEEEEKNKVEEEGTNEINYGAFDHVQDTHKEQNYYDTPTESSYDVDSNKIIDPSNDNSADKIKDNYDATESSADGVEDNYDPTESSMDGVKNNYDATESSVDGVKNNYDATESSVDRVKDNYDATESSMDEAKDNYDATESSMDEGNNHNEEEIMQISAEEAQEMINEEKQQSIEKEEAVLEQEEQELEDEIEILKIKEETLKEEENYVIEEDDEFDINNSINKNDVFGDSNADANNEEEEDENIKINNEENEIEEDNNMDYYDDFQVSEETDEVEEDYDYDFDIHNDHY